MSSREAWGEARGQEIAERGERLVDGLRLVKGGALHAQLLDALGAGEVDEVQLRAADDVRARAPRVRAL